MAGTPFRKQNGRPPSKHAEWRAEGEGAMTLVMHRESIVTTAMVSVVGRRPPANDVRLTSCQANQFGMRMEHV